MDHCTGSEASCTYSKGFWHRQERSVLLRFVCCYYVLTQPAADNTIQDFLWTPSIRASPTHRPMVRSLHGYCFPLTSVKQRQNYLRISNSPMRRPPSSPVTPEVPRAAHHHFLRIPPHPLGLARHRTPTCCRGRSTSRHVRSRG